MSSDTVREIPVEYVIYRISILKRAVVTIAVVSVAMLFFMKGCALGFFVGGLIAMANFSLLSKYVVEMRNFPVARAKRYIIGKFLIQYLVMAVTLFIGATKGITVFAGTALGLLVIKAVIFQEAVFTRHGHT
jgi:hypothetical protein